MGNLHIIQYLSLSFNVAEPDPDPSGSILFAQIWIKYYGSDPIRLDIFYLSGFECVPNITDLDPDHIISVRIHFIGLDSDLYQILQIQIWIESVWICFIGPDLDPDRIRGW